MNVVVGFINTTFSGVERGRSHLIQVGYQKGATIARQNFLFNVQDTPGTASEFNILSSRAGYKHTLRTFELANLLSIIAAGLGPQFDYTVNTMQARALWTATTPDNVVVTFRMDAIAQEPNETFTLTLIPLVQPNASEGLFFLDTIQVTIVDNDSKENNYHIPSSIRSLS